MAAAAPLARPTGGHAPAFPHRRRPRRAAAAWPLFIWGAAAWVSLGTASAVLEPEEAVAAAAAGESWVRTLSGSNWSLLLQGQWMVEFYAPWCPACQQMESAWEALARDGEDLEISVGKVDVTQEPGVSGRFFVTTLPTIFQMHGMAGLFYLSGWIRQIHSYLTGTLGIHEWGSYAVFILATLLLGLILGLLLVLLGDCIFPSKAKVEVSALDSVDRDYDQVEEQQEIPEDKGAELFAEKGLSDEDEEEEGEDESQDSSSDDSAVEGSATEEDSEHRTSDQSSLRQRKNQEAADEL